MILYGKPVVNQIKNKLKDFFEQKKYQDCYVIDFWLNQNDGSAAYIRQKEKFAQDIGIYMQVVSEDLSLADLLQKIDQYNHDPKCIGILVQLPLPSHLIAHQSQILSSINIYKDIDGLGGILVGLDSIYAIDFMPATPGAVWEVLKYYKLDQVTGKTITILSQSNLIGKPLAIKMIGQGATVYSCNHDTNPDTLISLCQSSDYIISATGQLGLVKHQHIYHPDHKYTSQKVIVDVGYGYIDGNPCGDLDREDISAHIDTQNPNIYITPTPGGVGPVTVAHLYYNIMILQNILHNHHIAHISI